MLNLPPKVPQVGFYYHYKHDDAKGVRDYAYEFLAVGFHTEDKYEPGDEWSAFYRPLYTEAAVYQAALKLGVPCVDKRPLMMWMEDITKDGITFPRFKKITDPQIIAELEKASKEMHGSK